MRSHFNAMLTGLLLLGAGAILPLRGGDESAEPRRGPYRTENFGFTGLLPATPESRASFEARARTVRRVRPNRFFLERVNAERAKRGKRLLTPADIGGLAEPGAELVTVPAAAGIAADEPAGMALNADETRIESVDNSIDDYFPPVRQQGAYGSCVQWAEAYYMLTNNTARARGWTDARTNKSRQFSPKFTYPLLNSERNDGSHYTDASYVASCIGIATIAEFDYADTDYPAYNEADLYGWDTDHAHWRNAINHRSGEYGEYIFGGTETNFAEIKQRLANGEVFVFMVDLDKYNWLPAKANPGSLAVTGAPVCVQNDSNTSNHAQTLVGYDDNLWVDLNENNQIDDGELGAFRVVNSWGPGWRPNNGTEFADADGKYWIAYEAFNADSTLLVQDKYNAARANPFVEGYLFWVRARSSYAPKMLAKFTVRLRDRRGFDLELGASDSATATEPSRTASFTFPDAVYRKGSGDGRKFRFDGGYEGTDTQEGTFWMDFTDIGDPATTKRWFIKATDSQTDDALVLVSFELYENINGVDVPRGVCADVPATVDDAGIYRYIDYDATNLRDFDNDGKADIVWRHGNTHGHAVWYMDGAARKGGGAALPATGDPLWRLEAAADFDGDGMADLLWRHATTHQPVLWLMDGVRHQSTEAVANPGAEWRVAAVGDFDGDGMADILWQHATTHQLAVWLMNKGTRKAAAALGTNPGGHYRVVGAADFNADGHDDVLFQHRGTRALAVWPMNGTSRMPGFVLAEIPPVEWEAVDVADFNGDGGACILFRHLNTHRLAFRRYLNAAPVGGAQTISPVAGRIWEVQPAR